MFDYGAGIGELTVKGVTGGKDADAYVFLGHNACLDGNINTAAAKTVQNKSISVFACYSDRYFSKPAEKAGVKPLIMSTGRMAPEAYNLHALVDAWSNGKDAEEIHEAVANAYNKYQKSGIKGARRLFTYSDNK